MIDFDHVSLRYAGAPALTLDDVDLHVEEGELALLVGPTGSGKSTLLRAANGLVPHFTGGLLSGRVRVDGRDTAQWQPRDLADVVGLVGQDPAATFVTDTVEDELAYTMESLGVGPQTMRVRVEETLDLLGLAALRRRPLTALSGGQAQRVAIGAALTAHPRVLVLDEPTSALDPQAAEEVLAAIRRLVDDLGMTVLMAEHRLERVIQYADTIAEIAAGRLLRSGDPHQVMAEATVVPPIVRLGRLAGWEPLPLSVRDARRRARTLRAELPDLPPQRLAGTATPGRTLAAASGLTVRYGRVEALRGLDFTARAGEVCALMGRNGAGKSTLLSVLAGLIAPTSGSVDVDGLEPRRAAPHELVRRVGMVPQDPADLLYASTVAEECATADRDFSVPPGTCAALLAELAPDVPADRHPRDLSEGQRMCLALAVVLSGAPALVVLDEPTRGLDYAAKERLCAELTRLAAEGHGILLSTHDVEVVAAVADRVVVLADGEAVADGPAQRVVTGSPMFAPQVAKVLAPLPYLTVGQVTAARAAA
ncbi:ABC transporter ATP-binding protein [Raineyella sp. LH-20]|uniref:ABC transporter ATP-binding protein n=1 Tax=Raineyella sp. LH-20 TaxID=3081204 RepID=UPI002955C045|nr:ATP-binding cassette domain-containing protein [Raineyella sp. LH-20]WOP19959.1 ATP-binding cassette domain-containing protein [Raineyella sp. LH-20]